MKRGAAAVWLVVVGLALAATPARAAGTRTDAFPAGPYTVTVTREDAVEVDHTTSFAVAMTPADGAGLDAFTFPGPGTPARPGRATTAPGGRADTYVVTARFPVRGAWVLVLAVTGRAGHGQAAVPVTVSAPGAIPQWLGWTIGLSPLAGLAVFLAVQVRTAHRLRAY